MGNEDYGYPCPCCGYLTFNLPPGSDEICRNCGWQDDISQLRFVLSDGANSASLVQAQEIFKANPNRLQPLNRRDQQRKYERDPSWRMVNVDKDNAERVMLEVEYGSTYPSDRTALYYWRANYWRKR